MRAELRITNGPFAGRKVVLRAGQSLKIGRTEWADFAVPHDANLSSIHFIIECEHASCKISDLQSINGTQVNGQPIDSLELQQGDLITAGNTKFSVLLEAIPPPASFADSSNKIPLVAMKVSELDHGPVVSSSPILKIGALVSNDFPFAAALQDEDSTIRRTALLAGAWQRQPWLLDYCRRVCGAEAMQDWTVYWLMAMLGKPSDTQLILSLGRRKELKESRFEILAAFGHPAVVPELIRVMKSHDLPAAIAAGDAWKKITGAALAPERESNYENAQRFWDRSQQAFHSGTRWRSGIEISAEVAPENLDLLDMASRWEIALRNNYEGRRTDPNLPSGQRFPT